MDLYPLITRDPASGAELIVTRLECPESGVVLEGNFALGWVGRLTPEQLDFVGLLLRNRNNLQKLANDLDVAYNTARARLDEVVAALGGSGDDEDAADSADPTAARAGAEALARLEAGEATFEEAMESLKKLRRR